MKRWPTILLIASLVLNIFLLGAAAGSVWRWTHGHHRGGQRDGWRMRAAEMLPASQAGAFRQAMRETVQASMPAIRARRTARAEAARLFVQPQFDAARVTAQLDRSRAAEMILRANLEHRVVGFAASLPLDQRQKLAEALKAGPLRERRGR